MNFKIVCEVSFPSLDMTFDIYIPINKSIEYICQMLDKIIKEKISSKYVSKQTSMLVNKRTGEVYDKNKLVKDTDLGNGSKIVYY